MLSSYIRRHVCVSGTTFAVLFAAAAAAYAQDAPMAPSITPEAMPGGASTVLLLELVKGGGLPAIVGWLGWVLSRTLAGGIPIRVELGDDTIRRLGESCTRVRE